MMSKNSFLTSMVENMKRRNWVPIFTFLAFFFYFPVAQTIFLQRKIWQQKQWPESNFVLENTYYDFFQINFVIIILAGAIAILCAIQGFSYLYQQKKVDLYHSVPIGKTKRFVVIYLNGILFYVVPYLINLLLGFAVVGVFSHISVTLLKTACLSFLINLLFYLCIYHIAILAVMLTGNIVTTLLGTSVFLLYEVAIRQLLSEACAGFFQTYSYLTGKLVTPWLSPVYVQIMIADSTMGEAKILNILSLLAMAIFFGGAAYFAYRKRPSEACGKAMALEGSKGIVKILLMIPTSVFSAFLCYSLSYGNDLLGIFGLLAGLLLSHMIMELIYEQDIHAIFHNKRQIAYAAGITILICAVFRYDLIQYDRYIPKREKIESVGISIEDNNYQNFYNEEAKGLGQTLYRMKTVQITDVDTVLQLVQSMISTKEGKTGETTIPVCIMYHMKNGKEISREYEMDYTQKEAVSLANKIYSSEEYKKNAYQIMDGTYFEDVLTMNADYDNGNLEQEIEQEEMAQLIAIYQEEMRGLDLYQTLNELPVGELRFSYEFIRKTDEYETYRWTYPVYDTFTKMKTFLNEKGCDVAYQMEADEVERITLHRRNETTGQSMEKILETKAELDEIVPSLYLEALANYRFDNFMENIEVEVFFKSKEDMRSEGSKYFRIRSELAPAWLKDIVWNSVQ